ncbi:hypothetical protein GCM10025782_21980 [Pedococcus ginsenosidimutans]|uniref:Uncharacterized protein n=1 Tax=Pedococcus ginsenosidimutans TaxID=490570 RepID=A0ABP8Y917_9MICO
MSDIERSRIRKEAADSVTSRTPQESDQAVDTALRRYLGIAMFDALRRRKDARRTETSPAGTTVEDTAKGPAKGTAKGAATTRKQGPRP